MIPDHAVEAVATQVARLYFDRQLSKVEIGQRLGMSRFRVARLLASARERGLVRIEYRDVADRDRELARELERTWQLDLCAVASPSDLDPVDAVARLAASVVSELVEQDESIGVAWGTTLAAMVDRFPRREHAALTVVPLAGGSARLEQGRGPVELARNLADRLGGRHEELYAPAFLASAEMRSALVQVAEVARIFEAYGGLSTALVGIGAWAPGRSTMSSSLLASGALTDDELESLLARGAVGELVVHPFDRDGRFVAPDLAERAVAIPLESLRAVPRVVAVAAGPAKAPAIRGALATGTIDVLVTDAEAAAAVIDEPGPRE